MRPRAIQNVPGLDQEATPFERFEIFARRIALIPKDEADKETDCRAFPPSKGTSGRVRRAKKNAE
jgi:hypothetical protein